MRNGRQQDLTLNMAQVAQQAEALVGLQEGAVRPTQATEPSAAGAGRRGPTRNDRAGRASSKGL